MIPQTCRTAAIVIDDHELFRMALTDILANALGFSRVHGAGGIDEAIDTLAREPDISFATMDLRMPGLKDLSVIRSICDTYPDLRLVVVSGSATRSEAMDCVKSGALGFVPKSLPATEILAVLRRVLDGEIYLPPQVTTAGATIFAPETRKSNLSDKPLTHRQAEVHRLLRMGRSNKLIARELGLSENTVKVHVYAICRLLGVRDRHEAAGAEASEAPRP